MSVRAIGWGGGENAGCMIEVLGSSPFFVTTQLCELHWAVHLLWAFVSLLKCVMLCGMVSFSHELYNSKVLYAWFYIYVCSCLVSQSWINNLDRSMQISDYDKRNSTRNLASPYTLAEMTCQGPGFIWKHKYSFRVPGSTILVIFFFTNLSFHFHQLILKK